MKRIGITQLAKLANVSLATADRALNGRSGISDETRDRVLRIAKEMGYKPNLAARALSSGKQKFRIGICTPRELHVFFDEMRAGLKSEAQNFEDYGLQAFFVTPSYSGEGQEAYIRSLVDQDIQALIFCPSDSETEIGLIDELESQGIRVICTPSDVPKSKRSSFVGINPDVSGSVAGELMAKFLEDGSQVGVLTGSMLVDAHRRKVSAFTNAFESRCLGGKVLEIIEGHDNEVLTFERSWKMLESQNNLRGVYVTTANCLPLCHTITARNLIGKVKLITTDLFPGMIPYFERNIISASIYQQPFRLGQQAIRVAIDAVMHCSLIEASYSFSPQIVVASNLALFRETSSSGQSPQRFDLL